jgi:hypothetical protein
MVLKFIFVDKRAGADTDHRLLSIDRVLQKFAISLLAAAVFLLGVVPDTLAAQILAAIP